MKKSIYTIFTIIFAAILISFIEKSQEDATTIHDEYNQLLTRYVSKEGIVNYKEFKNEQQKLTQYIAKLKNTPPQDSWTSNEQLAYWINLYNSLTINLLLKNYPIESITKIDKAWDTKIVTIDNKDYTLNSIENEVIRPIFSEPRIHFAVNCGAKSCPKLLNEAFTAQKLESQLQRQAISFINNTSLNEINENKISISKIFEWYAVDFGSITTYINNYTTTKVKKDAEVSYLEYDWGLNGY